MILICKNMESVEHNKKNKVENDFLNKEIQDKNIKILASYLEKGYTMLASHCPNCNSPMFRYHGSVFCPLCSNSNIKKSDDIINNNQFDISNKKNSIYNKKTSKSKNKDNNDNYLDKSITNINMRLFYIIENQLNMIEKEYDLEKVNKHLQIIDTCTKIILQLKSN